MSKDECIIKVSKLWKIYADNEEALNVDVNDNDQIESISSSDDYVIAARDVTFTIKRQDTFTIMGLSGSGKSTVIRCLLRLLEPTSGKVWINGYDVTTLDDEEIIDFRRKEVGMVFQHYGLLPHRTVIENAAFGLKLRGIPREEREKVAEEKLSIVGLDGWESHYPSSLSGGMQQRVGIARALTIDPPVLLLDEPFSGLDPLIRREMQDELMELEEKMKKTIVFVTHDLDEAIRIGSHLAVMKDGMIVQQGHPGEILSHPADDYVKSFVLDKKKQLEKAESEEALVEE